MDAQTQKQVIEALKKGFRKCRHHQKFTKRLEPIFQAEFGPDFYVRCAPASQNRLGWAEIHVWGREIPFHERIRLGLTTGQGDWQEAFLKEIQRVDCSDYEERQEQEKEFYSAFEQMEQSIAEIRGRALKMIESLPVPKSATIRAESCFWEGPSWELREKFPHLFGRLEK